MGESHRSRLPVTNQIRLCQQRGMQSQQGRPWCVIQQQTTCNLANSSNIALTVRTNRVCESSYRARQTRETADCRPVAACENATLEIPFAATRPDVFVARLRRILQCPVEEEGSRRHFVVRDGELNSSCLCYISFHPHLRFTLDTVHPILHTTRDGYHRKTYKTGQRSSRSLFPPSPHRAQRQSITRPTSSCFKAPQA